MQHSQSNHPSRCTQNGTLSVINTWRSSSTADSTWPRRQVRTTQATTVGCLSVCTWWIYSTDDRLSSQVPSTKLDCRRALLTTLNGSPRAVAKLVLSWELHGQKGHVSFCHQYAKLVAINHCAKFKVPIFTWYGNRTAWTGNAKCIKYCDFGVKGHSRSLAMSILIHRIGLLIRIETMGLVCTLIEKCIICKKKSQTLTNPITCIWRPTGVILFEFCQDLRNQKNSPWTIVCVVCVNICLAVLVEHPTCDRRTDRQTRRQYIPR